MINRGAQSRTEGIAPMARKRTASDIAAPIAVMRSRRANGSGRSHAIAVITAKYHSDSHSDERTRDASVCPVIDVRRAQGRRERRRFVDYAYERNAADPHWVPPLRLAEHERLNPKKNPFFAHADVELFLAWRAGRVVGRIAAIDDHL